jgi:hypothetical protein
MATASVPAGDAAGTTPLDAALDYAARGWPVIPCSGKVPLTAHGVKDATTDMDTIRAWWTATPNANIGIATGPPGPTVIDCDGPIGKHEWMKFVVGVGWDTPWSCTGGGGWHIFYAGDESVRNRAGWRPKVDVRGVGGYVIAPPSTHPSGADYWWVESPADCDLAPMPDFVRDAVTGPSRSASTGLRLAEVKSTSPLLRVGRSSSYSTAALEGEVARVRAAVAGTRNDTLVRASFSLAQLVSSGMLERDKVIGALFDAACSVGLSETETLRTIASGFRRGMERPRR